MMKKKTVLAGLMLAVVSIMAYAAEHGAEAGTGMGFDKAGACSDAKRSADIRAGTYGQTITGHSSCDCSKNEHAPANISWTCTVDAYWEKK